MKAVNLIPADQRRAGGSRLQDVGGPTLGLIGVLILALVVVVAYVTLSNGVAHRRAELARVQAQVTVAQQRAAALKPYGDVAAIRDRSIATVRQLAGARFDWTGLLGELSRRVPADVTLVSLTGDVSSATPAGAPAPGGGAQSSGPSLKLGGCTSDHSEVGRLMERLGSIPGVGDVQLGTSSKGDAATGSSGGAGCPRADRFDLTLTLTPAPVAPATGATAPASTPPTAS